MIPNSTHGGEECDYDTLKLALLYGTKCGTIMSVTLIDLTKLLKINKTGEEEEIRDFRNTNDKAKELHK